MNIVRLYLSPGHNYFGHHEKPAGENPVEEVDRVECVAGRGIRGDRFFDFKDNYKGQITFFSLEIHQQICAQLGIDPAEQNPAAYRRNVLTSGVDLNTLIGEEFELQGLRLQGVTECSPCYWMDRAIAPGAEAALAGNGGLRARILNDGELRVDTTAAPPS